MPISSLKWPLMSGSFRERLKMNAVHALILMVREAITSAMRKEGSSEAFMDAFDTASLRHEVSYIDFVNTPSCYSVHFCGTADIDALRSAWLACFGDNDGFPEHAVAWRRDMEEVARWKPCVDSGALDADSVGVL